ncbi:MAG: flagellar M-ring protein FliF [Proteobacteria bacterium]|nr:flagellar M-ring protein FliF [Pseudomonadota bacterium]
MDSATIIEGEAVPVSQITLGAFFKIPAVRQIMLLIGVAGSVAAGVAIVLWSQAPEYSRLYSDLDGADAAQVVEALRAAEIDFKLNADTGSVMVAKSRLHDARLELASQGLPQGTAVGMESLKEQSSFGQSQFHETAMYQHALEAELARTISYIAAVRDARVHLALPRQSAFMRDRKAASASVMLNLYRGRELESDQVASIVHLVASSVPNLLASNITLIDQQGRLLSSGERAENDAATMNQFKFAERLEQNYKRRIEDLLSPLLGPGRVRAEVVVDMDFTVTEETRESYDPGRSVLISESVSSNQRKGSGAAAQGIPGALSNQPPETGGAGSADATGADASTAVIDSSSSSTRNFEVDRTVSHTRPQSGTIRRLSIAVLVDDTPPSVAEDATPQSLTDADIERFTALIKEAVGFNETRGDTIVVINAPFQPIPEVAPAEPPKIWEQPIFVNSLKQILGVVLVLALAFGLVRPMLRSLLATNAATTARIAGTAGAGALMLAGAGQMSPGSAAMQLPNYDEKVAAAKNITGHDPAKVAQIVKKWVGASQA